ncbi:ABC transporter permease subunit [Streptomyces sp. DH37]|uniref:ABC transporter permease n=1 Tax=Streptomyces sp. DH37 TaxID=3040122 RepID=UPI0024414528|nr:ABC transporter permease subunit [Streptomyces sp. DH37]MDG9704619.1 ABC transporter permease subunit [Streptomyces sp. DH37]
MSTATAGGPAAPGPPGPPVPGTERRSSVVRTRPWLAACFLLPALVLLGALVVYPIVYSVYRSFFDASGTGFVGLDNYVELFTDDGILTAIRNNAIWVAVAPTVATALGLIFAVLTERVRWGTAFKLVVFMPMAISMLAAGIIFRLVYEQDPDRGVANAVWVGIHDTFNEASAWPGARPRPDGDLEKSGDGAYTTASAVDATGPANLPLVGVPPQDLADAADARPAEPAGDGQVTGTVWVDFSKGGGGEPNVVDPGEKALAGVEVEAVKDGRVVATATTGEDGTYALPAEADGALLRLPASNFTEAYNGVNWLGPSLITPAIIASYIWMWAGFAMVLIAAGLAGVPRELLEAARVDGANEWQVFRRVTVPVLAPVLAVVLVTLMINVLKIFDLVYIIAPGATQSDANVLALQLYLSSFGTGADQGVGSAIAVLLLLLVVPVMVFNIRRLRRENRR